MTISAYQGKGRNPNSHKNLEGHRRVPETHWGSAKKERTISLTDEAWEMLQQIATDQQMSASNLVEAMSRLLNQDPAVAAQAIELFRGRLARSTDDE